MNGYLVAGVSDPQGPSEIGVRWQRHRLAGVTSSVIPASTTPRLPGLSSSSAHPQAQVIRSEVPRVVRIDGADNCL
jgi:hypothetical protein